MKKAIVLISGGLDSATCLAIAKDQNFQVYALSFSYGQRHAIELEYAKRMAAQFKVAQHLVLPLDINVFGHSALTDFTIAVPTERLPDQSGEKIPSTYVPARNTIFLSMALGWAEVLAAESIFIGVNAVDYSGYPDCRPEFVNAFQQVINIATKRTVSGQKIAVEAPLLYLNKAEIIQWGMRLGVDYKETITCYQADASGVACGICESCQLRLQGFQQAGLEDPLNYRK